MTDDDILSGIVKVAMSKVSKYSLSQKIETFA